MEKEPFFFSSNAKWEASRCQSICLLPQAFQAALLVPIAVGLLPLPCRGDPRGEGQRTWGCWWDQGCWWDRAMPSPAAMPTWGTGCLSVAVHEHADVCVRCEGQVKGGWKWGMDGSSR